MPMTSDIARGALSIAEFQRRPIYRYRSSGHPPLPHIIAKVELLGAYLREHGPSRVYNAFLAIGGPMKGNLQNSILNTAGEFYPIWQEDGLIGILGYGDEEVMS